MFEADKGQAAPLKGQGLSIGIVQARFNEGVTHALAAACIAELQVHGVAAAQIHHVKVPGALEVPLALQALAETENYDALIALGCIIRGETYHFELVANESGAQLLAQFEGTAKASHAPERGRMDLRSYGIGAQILRDCGVHKMRLMGNPRRMPSMTGYGLEIAGYINKP